MSRFVRPSKYRHVFGQPAKKEHSIENIKVTTSAWDSNLIEASGLYISINWAAAGGGAFAILPAPSPFGPPAHNIPYKLPDIIPLARGHSAPVLDTAWSPFNDSVCVSGGEDGKILVWKVEASEFDDWGAEGWEPRDFDPVDRIAGSARKVGQVLFHPTASHVLASAAGDYIVKLWDLSNSEDPVVSLSGHGDTIQGLTFNHAGNLLATTCRDRKIRIFDTRAGSDPVRINDGHSGIKGSRIVWMGDKDRIATTGFSKMSDRQLSVWDTTSLTNVATTNIDQSAGVIMPFWSDNNILFLAGKGDGNIRYFEYDADKLHELSEYKSSDPQRGMGFLPRRAVNVGDCEIARFFKVAGSTVEPIAFIVPRRADSFQSDIYPPAPSLEPALTAAEFFTGKNAQPKLINLDSGAITSSSSPIVATPSKTITSSIPPVAQAPPASTHTPVTKNDIAPNLVNIEPASQPLPPSRQTTELLTSPTPNPQFKTESSIPPVSEDNSFKEENDRLVSELRTAKEKIRNLELQVETLRANAQRAAKALQVD